ncbi:MAG TPA: YlxR family protein [Firmicutes bacterium]|nr:YlxR family protein [Bacillota bacterium]
MSKTRKLPQRICVGCQERKSKRELIRIVRTPAGEVTVDLTGKKSGRGAYICPQAACLQKAIKGKRLEKNLQISISSEVITTLKSMLAPPEEKV